MSPISVRASLVPAAFLALALPFAPLLAQDTAPAATTEQEAEHQAAETQEQPVTQQLNNTVQGNIEATKVVNATAQGQYAVDMAQYRADVQAHHRAAMRDARRYDRQQRAYADAMSAWRTQVDACKRGHNKACRMPTPNPADFY